MVTTVVLTSPAHIVRPQPGQEEPGRLLSRLLPPGLSSLLPPRLFAHWRLARGWLDGGTGRAGGCRRSPGQTVQRLSLGLGLLSLELELHLQLLQLGGRGPGHPPHPAQLGEQLGDGVHGVPGGRGQGGQRGGLAGGGGRVVMASRPVGAQTSSTMSNSSGNNYISLVICLFSSCQCESMQCECSAGEPGHLCEEKLVA